MPDPFQINWDLVDDIEKVVVSFNIISTTDPIDEVREKLCIEPSYYYNAGELVVSEKPASKVGKRGRNQWTLQSDKLGVRSKDVNVHLRALFDVLTPWKQDIAAWASEHYVLFQVWFYSRDAIAGEGPAFEADVLRSLCSFGASLTCPVVCGANHQYEEDDEESGWIDVEWTTDGRLVRTDRDLS